MLGAMPEAMLEAGRTNSQAPRVNHVEADIGSEGSLRLAYGKLKYWTRPAPMLDSLDG